MVLLSSTHLVLLQLLIQHDLLRVEGPVRDHLWCWGGHLVNVALDRAVVRHDMLRVVWSRVQLALGVVVPLFCEHVYALSYVEVLGFHHCWFFHAANWTNWCFLTVFVKRFDPVNHMVIDTCLFVPLRLDFD